MRLATRLLTLAAAAALEAAFGYPEALFRRAGHPVTWIGAGIAALDRRLNDPARPAATRRGRGAAALAALLAASGGGALIVERRLGRAATVLAASTLLAARSLDRHVAAVRDARDLAAARTALGRIVGRDTATLDRQAVARAAIESLAENMSDGVVAPGLWLVIAGLPGLAIYKAVNTADSMIGHRTPRHAAYGWAAARLDDVMNLPASRLSAVLVALASGRTRAALGAALRDAPHHRSPNAGWPEAAMATALGLRIGGPRAYAGQKVDAAWMGHGRADADNADIDRALRLYRRALLLGFGTALALGAALGLAFALTPAGARRPSSSRACSAATRRGRRRADSPCP